MGKKAQAKREMKSKVRTTKSTRKKIDSVEPKNLNEALVYFSSGDESFPDYMGFYLWLESMLKSKENEYNPKIIKEGDISTEILVKLKLYKSYFENREDAAPTKPEMIRYKQLKLLLGAARNYFRDGVVDTLLSDKESLMFEDFSEIKKQNDAKKRAIIFQTLEDPTKEGISAKALRSAFALGSLSTEGNDDGEIDYLQGRLFEALNLWLPAIKSLEKVQPTHIDYSNTQFYLFRSMIKVSEQNELIRRYELSHGELTSSEIRLLLQYTFLFKPSYTDFAELLTSAILKLDEPSTEERGYSDLILNTVQLFLRYQDHIQQIRLSAEEGNLKTRQNQTVQSAALTLYDSDGVARVPLDDEDPLLWVQGGIYHAFSSYRSFFKTGKLEFFTAIHQDLFDRSYKLANANDLAGSVAFHELVLHAYWQEASPVDLLDRYWAHFKRFFTNHPESGIRLLIEYRSRFKADGSQNFKDADDTLGKFFPHYQSTALPDDYRPDPRLIRRLHPKSSFFYENACDQIKWAWSETDRIGDFGTISIGLFRIMENEFKECIFKPFIAMLGQDEVNSIVDAESRTKRGQQQLSSFASAVKAPERATLGEIRKTIEFLKKNLKNQQIGSALDKFKSILSISGIAAFEAGKMSNLISQDILNRYRNPPAHAHFLEFNTALEAKIYVDGALSKLFDWLHEASSE